VNDGTSKSGGYDGPASFTAIRMATEALTTANAAKNDLTGHEDLCAERYLNINNSIRDIKRVIWWVGTTLILLIVAALGWSLKQQIAANDAQREALETKVEMLERQERTVYLPQPQQSAPTVQAPPASVSGTR
jgi:hypothetical protein